MITWLRVENFKNLADVQTGFGPVNVVIGPNGCGKSSLLQAIDFLRAFFYPSIEDYLKERGFAYSDLPNLRKTGKLIRWRLRAALEPSASGDCAGEYEYVVTARRWRYLGVGEEKLTFRPCGGEWRTLIERKGRRLRRFAGVASRENLTAVGVPRSLMADMDARTKDKCPEMFHFRDWLTSFRSFLIWDPKILRRPDRGKHQELGASGEHLAPVLANLKRESPEKFARIVTRIRSLFPTVSDITIKGGRGWGWQEINLVEHNGARVLFNSQQMSDGVLRLLAICTFLYADAIPGVITFEEPENGIHPQLVSEVVHILKELSLRKPPDQCQVFLTTHSPYVLDHFFDHPEQVYVMERGRPLEGAKLLRLSDRRDIDLTKRIYQHSLGEAWFSGLLGGTARGSNSGGD